MSEHRYKMDRPVGCKAGTGFSFSGHPGLVHRRIQRGTIQFALTPSLVHRCKVIADRVQTFFSFQIWVAVAFV